MKTISLILAAVLFAGCTSAPTPVTSIQQTIAAAVEDTLSVGLVPILAKNPTYLQVAKGVAEALGSFRGTTLTPDDVNAFVGKTKLAPEDAKTVAALVNAAWGVYQKRYQAQVGASVRPDVKIFLSSVSIGILNAIAATPAG